jgi:hypothetical protein
LKLNALFYSALLLLTPCIAQAGPVLIVGTPGDADLSKNPGPSPALGNLINFDSLTAFSTFAPSTYASQGVTISSPDGLTVYPFSTQSGPNELFDDSSDGTANVTVALDFGTSAIGIGIADSDPVSVTLQALAANGSNLGSAFSINLATTESAVNTGNGYYVLEDTTSDIFGLRITESVGNASLFSGLAIDDLQTAPEPSSILLMTAGVAILGCFRLRKRA